MERLQGRKSNLILKSMWDQREREREREDVNDLLGSIEWPKKLALKLIFGLQSNLKYIAKPQYKHTCLCIIQYVKFIDLIWSIW